MRVQKVLTFIRPYTGMPYRLPSISISNCPLLLHDWYELEVKVQSEGVEVYRFSNNHVVYLAL